NHGNFYKAYLGLAEGEKASSGDNLNFFMKYQVNQMWWRYFCWNYIGRQNDIQNIMGEPDHGNWLSGIKPIDGLFFGDNDKLPDAYKHNRARNELYFLPFILGLLGLFYQYKNDRKNTFIVTLLFFFTGLAIVIYLNNTPMQPRERDYAYAGSTYAFAIWIGLGVLMVADWFKKLKLGAMSPVAASVLCLVAVPMLMASKEWDDHDRSKKTLPLATAKNFLNSCEPNAILFTEGDNDTYPLWYAQEIDGYRTDVRIINISLLGIDWYIDQLGYAVNKSGRIPLIWKPEQYRGEKRNYMRYNANPSLAQDKYYDLKEILEFVGDDKQAGALEGGGAANYFPVNKFSIPVDKDLVIKNKVLAPGDTSTIADKVLLSMPKNVAYKNDLAILNILAANAFKRPIYFANSIDPDHYEGLQEFLQLEGLAFKLVPVRTPGSTVNTPLRINYEKCKDLILNKFEFGGVENGVYTDQTNRRMVSSPKMLALQVAQQLIKNNRKEEAMQLIKHILKKVSEKSVPYVMSREDNSMIFITDVCIQAGDKEMAKMLLDKLMKFTEGEISYRNSLSADQKPSKDDDIEMDLTAMNYLANQANTHGMTDLGKAIGDNTNRLASQEPSMQQRRQ
nr:DUF2723 domain-containing protein [Chitinophagaceae bacterium]